jgi:hypothetical protein
MCFQSNHIFAQCNLCLFSLHGPKLMHAKVWLHAYTFHLDYIIEQIAYYLKLIMYKKIITSEFYPAGHVQWANCTMPSLAQATQG